MPPAGSRKRKALPDHPASQPTTKRPKVRTKTTKKEQPSTHASTSSTLVCLTALPDELLLQILQHLDARPDDWDYEERHKQAKDICLISRRLNRLGNDLLYQSFRSSRGFTSAGKFLRTLIANPALGPRVKQIRWSFEGTRFEPVGWKEDTYLPTSTDRRLLRTSLKALDIPNRERSELVQQYSSGLPAHMLKLILLHTPNVRELDIIDSESMCKRWEPYQTSVAKLLLGGVYGNGNQVGRAPTYTNLNRLNLSIGALTLDQICSAFHLPSLRTLSLVGGRSTIYQNTQSLIEERPNFVPSVTSLRVYKAHMGTDVLKHLMSLCGSLEHFEFEYFYCSATHNTLQEDISYPTISKALQRHKKTLKSITIDDVSHWNDRDYLADSRGQLSSFQDFDNLESMGAPIQAFNPTDYLTILEKEEEDEEEDYLPHTDFSVQLPKSLKELSLTIFEDEEHTDFCSESLTALHKTYRQAIPDLKTITIHAHNRVNITYVDFYLPKHSFRSSGVDFKVMQNGLEHDDLADMSDAELFSELDYMENFSDQDLFDTEDDLAHEDELEGNEDEDEDDVESMVFNMMQEALAGTQHSVSAAMENLMPYLDSLGYL